MSEFARTNKRHHHQVLLFSVDFGDFFLIVFSFGSKLSLLCAVTAHFRNSSATQKVFAKNSPIDQWAQDCLRCRRGTEEGSSGLATIHAHRLANS